MKDWMIRALKTLVQAFFGVLIPELALLLRQEWPENWAAFRAVLAPILIAAVSAAISAVWNLLAEKLRGDG